MNNLAVLIGVAVIGGIAVVLQARFMGVMDSSLGTLESVFITYGSGGLLIGLAMLAARGGNLAAWHSVPPYTLLAGVTGLIIVAAVGYSVSRLGLVLAFTIITATQYTGAAIFDHFGVLTEQARPLTPLRLLGVVVLLFGVWLILRPSS